MKLIVSAVRKHLGVLFCLCAFALLALHAAPAGPDAPFTGVSGLAHPAIREDHHR